MISHHEVEGMKYDSLGSFLLYTSLVEIRCTLLGLICVLRGRITGLWEPEFLLFAWGFKYLFSASKTNKVINVIKCSFLDLFVHILFLTVKIHLTLQLYITHFFASDQTCEIGRDSNTYFPHCINMRTHTQIGRASCRERV